MDTPQEGDDMDSRDNVRERFDALEQRTEQLQQHTRMVERRLWWWRGLACGGMVLGLLSGALPSGKTVDAQQGGLPARVAALEEKLVAVTFNSASNELVITKANLRIVNGLGTTNTTNGLGNVLVGYNEERRSGQDDIRSGSHNVVVGEQHNFSRFGGLVVGFFNEISGDFASISGGARNTASGAFSSVSGGDSNTASSAFSSVSGGDSNSASGEFSSVSGGTNRSAPGTEDWAAGPLFADN
jgi:hypothetical protein